MGTPRILIVEDDAFVALDLETIIQQECGAEVVAVASIAAAERAADGIDMAILDIDVVDGKTYELGRSLSERGTPVMFVSASRRDELPGALNSVPFVAKPYDPSVVAREIGRALDGRTFAQAAE